MNLTNIDLDTIEMLSEKLKISREEVIELAVRELAINVMSEDSVEEVQKQYKATIKEIRGKLFKVYDNINKGKISSEEANRELDIYNKLIKNFTELSKTDGNMTGFIADYKTRIELLQRERELRIKAKSQHVQEKMAEHSIAMGMIKYGEEL